MALNERRLAPQTRKRQLRWAIQPREHGYAQGLSAGVAGQAGQSSLEIAKAASGLGRIGFDGRSTTSLIVINDATLGTRKQRLAMVEAMPNVPTDAPIAVRARTRILRRVEAVYEFA